MIGCPAIQKLHLVGTNSRRIFCWPLDSDRQIFVLPQDSLLVSTICWPSPSRVWVLLKVFSGIIWLPHIIHNYASTIKNTTKDHTQDMEKINVWPGCKWYQAPWSARLLIIFQFFLQFPRRVVALHQLSKVTRAMCRDVKQALLLLSTLVFANSILRSEWCWRFSVGCTADAAGQDDLCTAELALTSYKACSIPPASLCSCTTCTRRRSVSYHFVQYARKSLSLHTKA